MALQLVFESWPPCYFSHTVNSKDWSTYLANTSEYSHFLHADGHPDTQEIHHLLSNLKDNCHIQQPTSGFYPQPDTNIPHLREPLIRADRLVISQHLYHTNAKIKQKLKKHLVDYFL